MFDPHTHADSLIAAWRRALQRVTHTAVDPKARRRPHSPEVFLFVTASRVPAFDASADLDAPLEAACLALALEATDQLADVPAREQRLIRDAARRAILAAQRDLQLDDTGEGDDDESENERDDETEDADTDEDAADARRLLIALASEGVRVLSGSTPAEPTRASPVNAPPGRGADAWHPPPAALVAMTRGRPDPIAAGAVASHVLRCAACEAALDVVSLTEAAPTPLRAAAASPPAMLAPGDGRLLARRAAPDAEAFAFDGAPETRLAIYVDTSQPVHYLAEGVTTDDMRPGYWSGRCARTTTRLEGTLHVGDAAEDWALDLGAR
jgi:hypothetical protein